MPRERLDKLLVARGLVTSRERARALVLAGEVLVDGVVTTKAGTLCPAEAKIEVRGAPIPWVSRGGVKLAAALDALGIDPGGSCCLDVGASTGGFTDVLLQRGATRVWAVDVGYGQLDWRLRNDPRVVVRERQNARHLSGEIVSDPIDLAVVDVSFISLTLVLPAVLALLAPSGEILCLVKPQFEAGRGATKGGVVRDEAVRQEAITRVRGCLTDLGLVVRAGVDSSLPGPKGNVEHFLWATRSDQAPDP